MSVNNDDHQELEALDTISLSDFTLTEDGYSGSEDHHHRNIPSPAITEDLFEFCSGRLGFSDQEHRMSHAEDIISGGKLIPINDQTVNKKHIHSRRSESMHELKSTTKGTTSQLVRNSYSLDYKKLNRNSKLIYDPTAEIHRNNLSNKTSSSRWSDLVFGPLKVPPEMDLRDIRNRQIFNTSNSLFRVGYHRKSSWGVLGILSCKSSGSVAVNVPLSYEKLSLKN